MPSRGEKEIRAGSMIVYGTHGSILTPILLAAAINRPDLKMVAADYIAKLGPNIAGCSFPVYAAMHVTVKRASDKGLVPRAMGWIASKSAGPSDRDAVRQRNRESLAGAAEHVRQGGGLIIAPESRNRREPWRTGLGTLVADLARDAACQSTYLVPWSIRGASVTAIFQLLSRNPLARRLGARRFRNPVQVLFGEPMLVERVVAEAGDDPREIAAYLERDYRERGF
ncbi:MAG: 1-acyl-sn-glycerol-3-phosphate acyltransferase [Candidatus Bipolaricaulis sp.]|nr:1-acyl-sn-glycerol-3-phosphate acyltransferase [Candidatus Bipolaricaulis sp.]